MKKICSKCKLEKDINDFHKDSSNKDGRRYLCKKCINEHNRSIDRSESAKKFQQTDKYKEYQKKYKKSTKYKEQQKIYRKTSPVAIAYNKKYIKSDKYKEYAIEYNKRPDVRLRNLLRCRIYQAIRNDWKVGSAVKDLGCSIYDLKIHLENKFTKGMSWDNIGKWHIDHVKPLSSFDLSYRKQFLEACNYINLQPLWAVDNLKKGNKIINNDKDNKI